MFEPDKQQIKKLKSLCHQLKPVVMIGQKGLHETVLEEIDAALEHHELVKIKLSVEKDEKPDLVEEIIEETDSVLIQSIGHMICLYRKNNRDPKIKI